MIITLKNVPKPSLGRLLQRRKQSLQQFVLEHGLTSYDDLVRLCDVKCVTPPIKMEYDEIVQVEQQNVDPTILTPIEQPPVTRRPFKKRAPASEQPDAVEQS